MKYSFMVTWASFTSRNNTVDTSHFYNITDTPIVALNNYKQMLYDF